MLETQLRPSCHLSQPPKYQAYRLHTSFFHVSFIIIINGVFVGPHVTEYLQPSEDNFVESSLLYGVSGGQTQNLSLIRQELLPA